METSKFRLFIWCLSVSLNTCSHLLFKEVFLIMTEWGIYENNTTLLGIILILFLSVFFPFGTLLSRGNGRSCVWFSPRSLSSVTPADRVGNGLSLVLWASFNQILIGHSQKFYATTAPVNIAGRTNCRLRILWSSWWPGFSFHSWNSIFPC